MKRLFASTDIDVALDKLEHVKYLYRYQASTFSVTTTSVGGTFIKLVHEIYLSQSDTK